jgi:hypothetical protein
MFHALGPKCQELYFETLESSPEPGKTSTVQVHVGIIYGHMFDFLWKDEEKGKNLLSPVFDKVYHEKGRGNKPRPFIQIGNLYFDYDPYISLVIPRKCIGDPKKELGHTFLVGDVVLKHETFPSSLIRVVRYFHFFKKRLVNI